MNSNLFVSVVLAGHNFLDRGIDFLEAMTTLLSAVSADYELIVVDNASTDGSLGAISESLESGLLRNTVVFSLAQRVEVDAALWIGVDTALGDVIATLPAAEDNLEALRILLERAQAGADVAIAVNHFPTSGTWQFRFVRNFLGKFLKGGTASLSRCMVMSRRLVSFLQNHSQPQMTFRQLTQIPGLRPDYFDYRSEPITPHKKTLRERYASGIQYVMWRNPGFLRTASLLALGGALLNLVYAAYVFAVFLFGDSAEPGWASSSLQFSGMFFLFSLVLFILSENVLLSISIAGRDPVAFVSGEYTSRHMGRLGSINVRNWAEDTTSASPGDSESN